MKTDNELIAEFMGLERSKANHDYFFIPEYHAFVAPANILYHQSWDWLMPVALKIKHLTYKDLKAQELPTFQQASARWRAVQNEISNLKIEASHYCIVKWIQWYNAQPK